MNNPFLIIITEPWLHSNIPDAAVEINNKFDAYRPDRPTPGGGILAYVNNHARSRPTHFEEDGKEVL